MSKVYTGKVMIPGDKIDEYFKFLEAAEKKRGPFKQFLLQLNNEFAGYLSAHFAKKQLENIHFKKWWKRKIWDSTTSDKIRVALKKFFNFLAEGKNIINEKVLKSFE
ncbi:MAG: hypothetical protein HQK79_21475 [Desulfobacterales bacterium]|nr:hypothetical protein [Desulfobacterales bacterium]